MGDSVCAEIMIVSDIFVEAEETFEVLLLPDPEDLFSAVIIPGMDRATVTIMDGEEYNSEFIKLAVLKKLYKYCVCFSNSIIMINY